MGREKQMFLTRLVTAGLQYEYSAPSPRVASIERASDYRADFLLNAYVSKFYRTLPTEHLGVARLDGYVFHEIYFRTNYVSEYNKI